MTKKILHVCLMDKFIPPYIDFVEEHFGLDDHFFWLNGDHLRYPTEQKNSTYKVTNGSINQIKGYTKLIRKMHQADKIILHGLFNFFVVQLLWTMPRLLKKCYWVIWGGDLYSYKLVEKNWKWKVKEFFRRPVIKNMEYVITGNSGDLRNVKEWYGFSGDVCNVIFYTSNIFFGDSLSSRIKTSNKLTLLVGNSATKSNRHFSALEIISKACQEKENFNVELYVPLSYGDANYALSVSKYGDKLFGDSFISLLDFIPYVDYLKLLDSIDIAVFNNNRQQGFGNIIQLLGKGKKVYISKDSNLWNYFKEHGIIVYSLDEFELSSIPENVRFSNHMKIKKMFSVNRIVADMDKFFYG